MTLTNESLVKDYIKQIWCRITDKRILFLVALAIPGREKKKKIQEVRSFGLGERKTVFNKTSVLFLTSHLGEKVLREKSGKVCLTKWSAEGDKGETSAPSQAVWLRQVLSFPICKIRAHCPQVL